jgi:hypothetical protein
MDSKGGRPTPSGSLIIEQRRARVAASYLRGEYQHDIAEREGVVQATISNDLKAIRAMWRESAVRDLDAHKERELARLDHLERTYWQAWERSLQERQSSHTKKANRKDGETTETGLRKEQRDGDPRFLDGVLSCITARCKLLGLQFDPLRQDLLVILARISDLEALSHELLDQPGNGPPGPSRTELLDHSGPQGPGPRDGEQDAAPDGPPADGGGGDGAGPVAG